MPDPHGKFIWYELMTSDLDAARAFYEPVMQWRIDPEPQGGVDYRMIAAADGVVGGAMQITPEMATHGARAMWLGYIAVDDVDATVDAIKADGGQVFMGPHTMPGVGRFAMVADPQGAPFYLMRPDGDGASAAFAPGSNGHGAWNELATTDPVAAMAFYAKHFGWSDAGKMSMGDAGAYHMFAHDGAPIGGMAAAHTDGPGPRWTYYIKVDGIDAALDRVVAAGGTVPHGPHEIPGGGFILHGTDQEGVAFALTGPRENDTE